MKRDDCYIPCMKRHLSKLNELNLGYEQNVRRMEHIIRILVDRVKTLEASPQWVSVMDRLPTESDADERGNVWYSDGKSVGSAHYTVLAEFKDMPWGSDYKWMARCKPCLPK